MFFSRRMEMILLIRWIDHHFADQSLLHSVLPADSSTPVEQHRRFSKDSVVQAVSLDLAEWEAQPVGLRVETRGFN